MLKYFKRKERDEITLPPAVDEVNDDLNQQNGEQSELTLVADPGLRTRILDYNPNVRDQVRLSYLTKGPCQPRQKTYPKSKFGDKGRQFNQSWFDDHPSWLEYSKAKDAVYCLYCYVFKSSLGEQAGGDAFIGEGFKNWKKKNRLQEHVGELNSAHNKARRMCEALINQDEHININISNQSDKARRDYKTRLNASVDVTRHLLRQGHAFRGHDETATSQNKGNFIELLEWYADKNDDVKAVTLNNAPANLKLTSPDIQKDIVNASAVETVNIIMQEIGNKVFSLLVDESKDVSGKEQMAIVLRYVNDGYVIERFVGVVHVGETTSLKLKEAIDDFFSRHGLCMSRLRGQGYDGANNMRGEFNGLKTLILKENKCAFYIHCFAHQLQLALVYVAKNHTKITALFTLVSNVVTVCGGSFKRRDFLRDQQALKVIEALRNEEISSGRGLNQEKSLKKPGDTRWGSHYGTLIRVIDMFSTIIELLEKIKEDGDSDHRHEAGRLLDGMETFDFVFSLYLMKSLLGLANNLSQALQRKDQDIVNAVTLVKICKENMQNMRDNGWDCLLEQVVSFCEKNNIDVPQMDDPYFAQKRSRRKAQKISNLHNYRVELFSAVIDMLLQELNSRFDETSTELLLCVACLNPLDSFSAFNKSRLLSLARFYPEDFSRFDISVLDDELETFISDMRGNAEFSHLKGVGELARKMVETKKDNVYPLVYLLLTLALTLPVATATVERVFSAMKILKTNLRNRMGDAWMNDNMLIYIEKALYNTLDNETIMQRFQKMKFRRGQL